MSSVWVESVPRRRFDSLKGNIKTDVLIIGGGMAGLLSLYMLGRAGVDCVLVEADRMCGGITENTTAKLTYQHGLIYDKLTRRLGPEKSALYLEAHRAALNEYSKLCEECEYDYEIRDFYVYSRSERRKIEREVEALASLGVKAEFFDKVNLPFNVAGAVRIPNQAQFNPLKFAFSVAKGMPIMRAQRF